MMRKESLYVVNGRRLDDDKERRLFEEEISASKAFRERKSQRKHHEMRNMELIKGKEWKREERRKGEGQRKKKGVSSKASLFPVCSRPATR